MTTKERIVLQAIEEAEKEVNEIKCLLSCNPYAEMLQLETETIEKVKALNREGDYQSGLVLLEAAQKERDRLMDIAKRQQNSLKLIDRRVALEFELGELYMEKYRIDHEKERKATPTP